MKSTARSVPNRLLREARENRGWSQQYVAARISAQRYYISRWERGMVSPSPYYRQQLCTLFGKDARELGLLAAQDSEHVSTPNQQASIDVSFLPLWNVPYRRNPFFTARSGFLTLLHERLQAHSLGNARLPLTLSGLAGMGKTQIAVEYAYRFRSFYKAVLWLRADSSEVLLTDCRTVLERLGLSKGDIQDHHLILSLLQRWLGTYREWLLILDNIDDATLLNDLLPVEYHGSVILTTKAQTLGGLTETIIVDRLSLEEGMLLLLHRARALPLNHSLPVVSPALQAEAEMIVSLLGGFPLALDQAGAYIEEMGCGVSAYCDRYRQKGAELLRRRGMGPHDYPLSVMTTLSVSLEKLTCMAPAALDVLRLCSFLSGETIPEEISTSGATNLGTHLEALAADPLAWDAALGALRRFSLLDRDFTTKTLTMHQLVQMAVKEDMDNLEQRVWAERAVQVMNKLIPDGDSSRQMTWIPWQRYITHTCTCAVLIDQWQITGSAAIRLLYQTSMYLVESAHYRDAERLYRQTLDLCWKELGAEHAQTGEVLNDLAILCYYTGSYQEAEPLYLQALAICEQALGKEHPKVVHIYHNLGLLYCEQGQLIQAKLLLQQALHQRERLYGAIAPTVAESLHSLALVSLKAQNFLEAQTLIQRALSIRRQVLGDEHALVAASLTLLGRVFAAQGSDTEAEQTLIQALRIYEKLGRMDNSPAANGLQALGELYLKQEKYQQAEDCLQRALYIREKLLPSEHYKRRETLQSLEQLRTVKQNLGKI